MLTHALRMIEAVGPDYQFYLPVIGSRASEEVVPCPDFVPSY